MQSLIGPDGTARIRVEPEFTQVSDNVVIGAARWQDRDGKPQEWFEVISFRGGRIVDMQDCRTRRLAERFAQSR